MSHLFIVIIFIASIIGAIIGSIYCYFNKSADPVQVQIGTIASITLSAAAFAAIVLWPFIVIDYLIASWEMIAFAVSYLIGSIVAIGDISMDLEALAKMAPEAANLNVTQRIVCTGLFFGGAVLIGIFLLSW
jgi:hypothetical protein